LVQVCPGCSRKLLVKNGFSKNADGQVAAAGRDSPGGSTCLTGTEVTHLGVRNCVAAVQQWKKFGIDAEMYPSDASLN
jgi:peptide/nickel transport system substrate-binding protein